MIRQTTRLEAKFCTKDWNFAMTSDDMSVLNTKAMSDLVFQCVTKLNEIVTPKGLNIGLSTNSDLLLGKSEDMEDVSVKRDGSILGCVSGELGETFNMELKIPLAPTQELQVPENTILRLYIMARPRSDYAHMPIFAAVQAITELRKLLLEGE